MTKLSPSVRYALLAVVWIAAISLSSSGVITIQQLSRTVSSTSSGAIHQTDFEQIWKVVWWIFVKGWHAAEFGILYFLVRKTLKFHFAWSIFLCVVFAFLDEFHQVFVPFRGGRLSDVLIDFIGILLCHNLLAIKEKRDDRRNLWIEVTKWFVAVVLIFLLSIYPFGTFAQPFGGQKEPTTTGPRL